MNPELLRSLTIAADVAESIGLVAVLMMAGGLLYMLSRIARYRLACWRRERRISWLADGRHRGRVAIAGRAR